MVGDNELHLEAVSTAPDNTDCTKLGTCCAVIPVAIKPARLASPAGMRVHCRRCEEVPWGDGKRTLTKAWSTRIPTRSLFDESIAPPKRNAVGVNPLLQCRRKGLLADDHGDQIRIRMTPHVFGDPQIASGKT